MLKAAVTTDENGALWWWSVDTLSFLYGYSKFVAIVCTSGIRLLHRALCVAAPSSVVAIRVAWRGLLARMWIGYDDVDRLLTSG